MNAKSETLMRRLNSIQVTPQDLEMVIQATRSVREHLRNFTSVVGVITDKLPNAKINYRTAVAFRLLALARIATENRTPGFVSDAEGGVTITSAAVVAAAKCRLVVVGDQVFFDRAEFLQEALRAAPAQGSA